MSEFRLEIGRKFAGIFGVFPGSGRVTTCAFSHSEGREAVSEALAKTGYRKGARISLKVLRYSLVRPSGPGDLPRGRLAVAC